MTFLKMKLVYLLVEVMKLKKIIIGCLNLLVVLTVVGCSNQNSSINHAKSINNSVVKKKSTRKERTVKRSSNTKKVIKEQSEHSQSVQVTKNNSKNQSIQNIDNNVQSNTSPNTKSQDSQTNKSQLPPASSLSDFVNRYGVSPSLYLVQHNGMSIKEALDAVPDNMKTSGELQTQHNLSQ